MRRRFLASLGLSAGILAALAVVSVGVHGQAPAPVAEKKAAGTKWVAPRAADGHPDMQGVWANNTATPLERPKILEGRATLTENEVAVLRERAAKLFQADADAAFGDSVYEAALADAKTFVSKDGKTGDYNHFWLVDRDFDNRTSLITSPADGRIPALTEEAQARKKAAAGRRTERPEGPEDRSLSERCISFGMPRINAGYNSYVQILQSSSTVGIQTETIHDARLIPLDGRPHLPANVRQWHGDSRGTWKGDTLEIDTTNYSAKGAVQGATEALHVVERFTRVGPDTLNWEITFNDPHTWSQPWTLMIPLKRSTEPIFEYACHEGNTGLAGILSGARAEEKALAAAQSTKQ
jgi:hypothetical protein